jgi:dUTP pyrophosphatase
MSDESFCNYCPSVKFIKTDSNAIIPTKGEPLSMGFDLTAIGIWKKYGEKIILFETGIAVEPPDGYYTEIFPRSSLSSTGYMLANSIGLIDPSYRGSLKIALIKIDEKMPDLKLPFTKCQLVLRKCEYFKMEQVQNLTNTTRGVGGFGSTDYCKI